VPPDAMAMQAGAAMGMPAAAVNMGGLGGFGMMPQGYGQVDPKKARTAYVGGLTPALTQELLRRFFEEQVPMVEERPPVRGPCVETVSINSNGMYAFVEFYNNFDADIAMCMDGMKLNGVQLQIRRPKNYTPTMTTKKYTIPGLISSRVPDGPHKIFLGGLPSHLMDADVQAIASSFGPLSAFSLIKERTGVSKGYAFFCYSDPSITNYVCASLNGKEIHGKAVACKPANQKDVLDLVAAAGNSTGSMAVASLLQQAPPIPSCYLRMENMVTSEELLNNGEYKEIFDDVRTECSRYGNLVALLIPRPPSPNAGLIFLQYSNLNEAAAAIAQLQGRTFAERLISIRAIPQNQWPTER